MNQFTGQPLTQYEIVQHQQQQELNAYFNELAMRKMKADAEASEINTNVIKNTLAIQEMDIKKKDTASELKKLTNEVSEKKKEMEQLEKKISEAEKKLSELQKKLSESSESSEKSSSVWKTFSPLVEEKVEETEFPKSEAHPFGDYAEVCKHGSKCHRFNPTSKLGECNFMHLINGIHSFPKKCNFGVNCKKKESGQCHYIHD